MCVFVSRELRLSNEQLQHQAQMSEVRVQHERAVENLSHMHERQMAGVLALADSLKAEVVEAQRASEKHRATVGILKEQIKEALVVTDVMQQELASEKLYNAELSQVVTQVKGSALSGRDASPLRGGGPSLGPAYRRL